MSDVELAADIVIGIWLQVTRGFLARGHPTGIDQPSARRDASSSRPRSALTSVGLSMSAGRMFWWAMHLMKA